MNRHLNMRSGNPALSSKIFTNTAGVDAEKMTIEGTINKTAMSLLLLMAAASYTWINPSPVLMMLGFIGGFIIALIQILSQKREIIYKRSKIKKLQLELNTLRNQSIDDDLVLMDDFEENKESEKLID